MLAQSFEARLGAWRGDPIACGVGCYISIRVTSRREACEPTSVLKSADAVSASASDSGRSVDSDGAVDSVVVEAAVLGRSGGGRGSPAGSVLDECAEVELDWLADLFERGAT